jgi:hypothetical protein
MAGRPKRAAMIAELTRRATAEGEDVLTYAETWVASGNTILQLANEIGRKVGHDILRESLAKYLNGLDNGRGREVLAAARVSGAAGLADQSVDVTDAANTKEKAAIARGQMASRQWLAGKLDRAGFGERVDSKVSLSVAMLHLDALKALPALPAPTEAVFEVVPEAGAALALPASSTEEHDAHARVIGTTL